MADQRGEPAGEAGDGVEVRAAAAGVGEIDVFVVGEFVAGSHDPGGDPSGRRHPDCGRRGRPGAVDGEPVPQHPQAALVAAGQDLGVQVSGLVDAVGKALPQVGVERGEDAGSAAGIRADQRLGGGGMGVLTGGSDVHVEAAGGRADRQSFGS
ncbi:hypothetical protein V1633_16715 [Plantactinospora sonchi]|uniref:Uncharacterized protein n=1 Tax=Plantactinospora sonchi TaxID=1544735 RepID=A0ABU7RUL4_9ACTN